MINISLEFINKLKMELWYDWLNDNWTQGCISMRIGDKLIVALWAYSFWGLIMGI